MSAVGPEGAFSVNGIGSECRPYPLSFSVREAEGAWRVAAGAAQAGELVDLLVAATNDAVAVSLETTSFLDTDWRTLRPCCRGPGDGGSMTGVGQPW